MRNLVLRTLTFLSLTAASTTLYALPYLTVQ